MKTITASGRATATELSYGRAERAEGFVVAPQFAAILARAEARAAARMAKSAAQEAEAKARQEAN